VLVFSRTFAGTVIVGALTPIAGPFPLVGEIVLPEVPPRSTRPADHPQPADPAFLAITSVSTTSDAVPPL
jgi:hypothetical protein